MIDAIIALAICGLWLLAMMVGGSLLERRRIQIGGDVATQIQAGGSITLTAVMAEERGYPKPDHQIVAWTPQERELFGVNDTIRLIDRIDQALKAEMSKEMPDLSTMRIPPSKRADLLVVEDGTGRPIYHPGGVIQ